MQQPSVELRTALFSVTAHRVVAISYRRFETTYRAHLQASRSLILEDVADRQFRNFKGPIGRPETSVINYHYSLRNNTEDSSFHLPRSAGLKLRWSCLFIL